MFKGDGTDSVPASSSVILYGPLASLNQDTYHGCNIYDKNDYYNQDVTNAPLDPNNATIKANAPAGNFDTGDEQIDEQVNLGTSATPVFTVVATGSHHPPLYNSATMPWVNGYFIEAASDHHAIVLLTDTCADYETYGTTWNNGTTTLSANTGQMNALKQSWQSQMINGHDAVTAAGTSLIQCVYWGEEASLASINHAGCIAMPTGKDYSQLGYVHPATHPSDIADTGCSAAACPHPYHNGDHLRLPASFNCAPYTTKGQLICNALKKYGIFIDDQAGQPSFKMGMSTAGVKGWNYTTDLKPLFSALTLTSFDVLNEPQIQCESGTLGSTCF